MKTKDHSERELDISSITSLESILESGLLPESFPARLPPEVRSTLTLLAQVYGKIRSIPGIWQNIIQELLQVSGYSLDRLAEEIQVAPKTIRRILVVSTRLPRFETSFRLFILHLLLRPDRYLDSAYELALKLH